MNINIHILSKKIYRVDEGEGSIYIILSGTVKKIDEHKRQVVLIDDIKISSWQSWRSFLLGYSIKYGLVLIIYKRETIFAYLIC